MSSGSEKIRDMLYKAEEYQRGAHILADALDALREEGGEVKLCVYTKSGHKDCTSILTEKTSEECLKILIKEYNDQVKSIKEEVNVVLDNMIDSYVL